MSTLTYPHPHDFMSGGHRIGQLVASFDAPSSLGGVMANAGQPIPQAFSDPQHQITYLAGSMGRETPAQIVDKVAAQYGLNQTERKHLETDLRQQVGNFSQALDHIVFTPSQPKYLSITLPSGSVYNPAAQYFQNTAAPSVPIISDGNGVQVRARYVSAGTSLGALWQEAQQLDPRLTRDTFIALNAERFGLFPAVASAIDMRNLPNETPVDTAGLVFLTTPQVDLPGIEAIAQRPNNREKIATFLKEVLVLMGEKMPEEAYDAFVSGELTLSAVVGAGLSHYLGGSAAAATAAGKVALGIGSFLTGALMGILKNATEFDTLPEVRTYARQLTNDGRIPARAFAHLLAGGLGALGYRPLLAGLMAQETTVVGAGTTANVIDITPGAARALAPNTSGQIAPQAINAPSLISGQTTGAMGGAVAMSPARPSGTSQNFTTRFEATSLPTTLTSPQGMCRP